MVNSSLLLIVHRVEGSLGPRHKNIKDIVFASPGRSLPPRKIAQRKITEKPYKFRTGKIASLCKCCEDDQHSS